MLTSLQRFSESAGGPGSLPGMATGGEARRGGPRGPAAAGAPSLADVARLAGVSSQTVSRVSSGATNVRPETRERVLQAMNQLGYSPNRAAQALRRGSFRTIGVLTQQIQRTGEALTTAGVLEAASAATTPSASPRWRIPSRRT